PSPAGTAPARMAEPERTTPDVARAGRHVGLETWLLAALFGSLGLFWAAWLLDGRTVGSPYGLRATLFTGLATLFCLLHAWRSRVARFTLWCFGVAFGTSLVAELVGTSTGLVFGAYRYGADVPGRVLGLVPVVVPFVWFAVSYLSYVTADILCAPRSASRAAPAGVVSRALVGAALLVAYDLVADPNHVYRGGWTYAGGGAYYGVPLQNFVAWFALGFLSLLLIAAMEPLVDSPDGARPDLFLAMLGPVAYAGVLVQEGFFAILVAGHTGASPLSLR